MIVSYNYLRQKIISQMFFSLGLIKMIVNPFILLSIALLVISVWPLFVKFTNEM